MMTVGNQSTCAFLNKGLSIIELLVAIALGAILLTGAISLFVSNRATYELTTDMARLQENARFALQSMVTDIRMARHIGCVNNFVEVKNQTPYSNGELGDPSHALEGFEAGKANWSPSGYDGGGTSPVANFLDNADAITVRYMATDLRDFDDNGILDMAVTNTAYQDSLEIEVENETAAILTKELAVIADCGRAEVFNVTDTDTATNSLTAFALSRQYDPTTRPIIGRFIAARYFVRNNLEGIPSLFRVSFTPENSTELATASQEELVDGVQSMQILYGLDTNLDGVPEQFLAAGAPGLQTRNDWLSVSSVRIALLMSTVDAISKAVDNNIYEVGDERFCNTKVVPAPDPDCTVTWTPDNRLRRVFQTTVSIRNFVRAP